MKARLELRPDNVNLASDIITDTVRVSTAAIHMSAHFGHYWQLETWVFSEDPTQKSVQRVHTTFYSDGKTEWNKRSEEYIIRKFVEQAKKAHAYIVNNLKQLTARRLNHAD